MSSRVVTWWGEGLGGRRDSRRKPDRQREQEPFSPSWQRLTW